MKALVLILSLGLLQATYADAFDDGLAAYERGDYETAIQLWKPLAKQGDVDAQFNLGTMYDEGKGVTQDDKEAVIWYRKAANQGDGLAQFNLGNMYVFGRGVRQDYIEAMHLYRMAAAQGITLAQRNLGWMYEEGLGVPQDKGIAYGYYSLAAAQGDKDAKGALKRLTENETSQRTLIRNIQQHLTEMGYQPGAIDGMPGKQTIAAVKKYQQDNGLKSDGVISEGLLTSLKKSVGENSTEWQRKE